MATDCLFKITIDLKEPIVQGDRYITYINIPCGKCGRCIERRKMEWSFRMNEEMVNSKTAYFVTLTYAPEFVPYNKYGKKTLIPTRKDDIKIRKETEGRKRITKKWKEQQIDRSLQGFMKRLRQNQKRTKATLEHLFNNLKPNDKIKFYGCGEYGERRGRPHYHLIIFNTTRKAIELSWTLGETHIVKATEATINYVMKYLDKRHGKEPKWGIIQEFNTMSDGIGESYIEKNKTWHNRNIDILFVTNNKGIRIPMCKYYRDRIFTEETRKEQVLIVTNKLDEIKWDLINEIGIEAYNKSRSELKKETEKRFRKKIKKRIVD